MENPKKVNKDYKKSKASETEVKKFKNSIMKNAVLNSPNKEKVESKLEHQESKTIGDNRPKFQCNQCLQFEVKHKIYKCFSCGKFKCLNCASLDTIKTKQNIKGDSYICEECFSFGPKNRKKNHETLNYNQILNPPSYSNSTINNDNSKYENNSSNKESNIGPDFIENNNAKNIKLIGKKRKKDSSIFDMSFIEKDAQNIDRILDLDKLHSQVTQPVELYSDNIKKDKLYTLNNQAFRKSIRLKKPIPTAMVSIINCHQCKKIDITTNILTCANEYCRESYCINCTKKYIKGSSISKIMRLKLSEENNSWICFKCKKQCNCKACKDEKNKIVVQNDPINHINSAVDASSLRSDNIHKGEQKNKNMEIKKNKFKNKKNSLSTVKINMPQNLEYNDHKYSRNFPLDTICISSSSNNTTGNRFQDQNNRKKTNSNMIITIPNIELGLFNEVDQTYIKRNIVNEIESLTNNDSHENNKVCYSGGKYLNKRFSNKSDEFDNDKSSINKVISKNQKLVKTEIDNFVIYEMIENIDKTEFEKIIEYEEQMILKDNKLYSNLISIADKVENFSMSYMNTDFQVTEKLCFICNNQNIQIDSLLLFNSFENFLGYLKFIMIFRRKLLMINEKKFAKNLNEIFDFIDAYDENLKKKIYFNGQKFCCKFCIISIVNKTNLLFRILRMIKLSINPYKNNQDNYPLNNNNDLCLNELSKFKSPLNNELEEGGLEQKQIKINSNLNSNLSFNSKHIKRNIKNNSNNNDDELNCKSKSFNNNFENKKLYQNLLKKPSKNLSKDLSNFNDKPDNFLFKNERENNSKLNRNYSSNLDKLESLKNVNNKNLHLNNLNKSITKSNKSNNLNNKASNSILTGCLIDDFEKNSNLNSNISKNNILYNSNKNINPKINNLINSKDINDFTSNFDNKKKFNYNEFKENFQVNKNINFNFNPIPNSQNLSLVISKMLNIKHHLDTNNCLFSNNSQINDPEKLKKCMLDTNILITDLLKHLNNVLDEVKKNSYYLSLVFLKTDKLKETINQIFPYLDNIVNQIQNSLQQKEEKNFNEFRITLRDTICINELLRLCKFELSEMNKVKNYAQRNIMSEDILKIFTVFLNLGKNPNFIHSLLGLFKNIREAAQNQCGRGNDSTNFQKSNENNNNNNSFNKNVDENKNSNCENKNEIEIINLDLSKENNSNDNIPILDKIKNDIFSNLNFHKYFDKNINILENIDFGNNLNNNIKDFEISYVNNNNLNFNEEKIEDINYNKEISKNPINKYSNFIETNNIFNYNNNFSNINQKSNSNNENYNPFDQKFSSSLIELIDNLAKIDGTSKLLKEKENVKEKETEKENEKEKENKKEEENTTEIKTIKEVKLEKEDVLSIKDTENKEEEKIELEINLLNESNNQIHISDKNSNILENPMIENSNFLKNEDIEKNISFCLENSFGIKNDIKHKSKELENYYLNKIQNNNLNLHDREILGIENKIIGKNEIVQKDKIELHEDIQKLNFFSDNVFTKKLSSIPVPNDASKNEKKCSLRNCQNENFKQDSSLHYSRNYDSHKKEFQTNEDCKEIYSNNPRDNTKNSIENEKKDCEMDIIFCKEKQNDLKSAMEKNMNKGNSPHFIEQLKESIGENFDDNMYIDNIKTNSIFTSVKKKKEDIFTIIQRESNINLNLQNKIFSPKNNNFNQNNISNSSVIFKSTKTENNYFINSDIFHDKFNRNNKLMNSNIIYNNNILNNINLNKISNLGSKYPISRINQYLNDPNFKNGKFSDNNVKISPSKQHPNDIKSNINSIKIEEKKKYLYMNNDADDSINIQEHFNVNVQHDNIINDEPIKNTILNLAYEQPNETSSPKVFGLNKKMFEKF